MKKLSNIKIFLLIGILAFTGFVNLAQADATLSVEESIILDNGCEVEDTNSVIHIFPEEDSTSEYLAICALAKALEQNFVDNIEFIDFGFGLFVNSINSISQENTYWKLHLNTLGANVGIGQLAIQAGDVVSLVLTAFDPVTFEEELLEPHLTLTIESLASESLPEEELEVPLNSGGGGFVYKTPPLSIPEALDYLKDVHQIYKSGNDSDLYTDWAAIAYSSAGILDEVHDLVFSNLKNYNTSSSLLTDNERRTMVLLSLGENPYSFSGVNYVEAIIGAFDGVQFGDPVLVNDDVFALIPLASVGYTADDEIITQDVSFILSRQNKGNGSWEDSVDLTAATIQALSPFKSIGGVSSAISRASNYLKNTQRENGGWESVYATSWAMQAMNTLNVLWSRGGQGPVEYFNSQQNEDGAILLSDTSIKNKMWATSYVIPAVLGKPWAAIFTKFSKPTKDEVVVTSKLDAQVPQPKQVENKTIDNVSLEANVIESKHSLVETFLSAGSSVLDSIRSGIRRLFP